jgi:hypothetical protein
MQTAAALGHASARENNCMQGVSGSQPPHSYMHYAVTQTQAY